MVKSPRVTVIIPTYNRAAFLKEAVASVLGQTFGDFEIIISDDGSTDNTSHIVSQFARPLRYLRLEHSGHPAIVRNRALEAASAELVAFLDDDDVWADDKLEKQVAMFDERPQLDFVYCDARALYTGQEPSGPLLTREQQQPQRLFEALLVSCFIYPSMVMARRVHLLAAGGFDEMLPIVEDYDLWLRLAYRGHAGFLPQTAVTVRRHEGGISANRRRQTAEGTITVLMRVWRQMQLTASQRRLLRASLARAHTHFGILLCQEGEQPAARRQLWRALRWDPLWRRAWLELLKTWAVW